MKLSELVYEIEGAEVVGDINVDVTGVQFDSRKLRSGDLFVAVSGTQVDGHNFIQKALENGVRSVVCERIPADPPSNVTFVIVPDSSFALGILAQNFFKKPSTKLKVVGITGTNGKTTASTLLYRFFSGIGHPVGLLSTIQNYVADEVVPSTHTTGDALQIASLMAKMVEKGCSHCFMEVTSHAIDQNRIAGIKFDGAVFTNLTHDHLDYHKTFECYRDVKQSFFTSLPAGAFALTNASDANGSYMVENCRATVSTYGELGRDFKLEIAELRADGTTIIINGIKIDTQLVGAFNAYNMCVAFGVASLLGCELDTIVNRLPLLAPVEGRMQKIVLANGAVGIVDFAHTPDALEKALDTIRTSVGQKSRILTVVGCGGDRDRDKRPLMGEIAARLSDSVVLTADNPRSEDAGVIAEAMYSGVPIENQSRIQVIIDRRQAIERACSEARPTDVVLVAGKGHEKYQEISGIRHPFDDAQVLRDLFNIA